MKQEELFSFLDSLESITKKKKKMAKAKHIHQYERRDIGKKGPYIVYKCVLANCPHYVPDTLIVGRLSICPYCTEPFTIETSDLTLVKPHCKNCINETARENSLKRKNLKEKETVTADLGDKLLASIKKRA